MNIVWFSWKDRTHPLAGGAETVSGEIMDRLIRDGHSVKHVTASYAGAKDSEIISGVEIVRLGNKYTVYRKARRYFKDNLNDWATVVIDEMNTIPFVTPLFFKGKNILLTYQLARTVWFHQMRLPFSIIGYLLEPLYLRYIAKKYTFVLTESESTKLDLIRHGFNADNIQIFKVGMALKPLESLLQVKDYKTILFLGAMRPMKRTMDAVKAFECARDIDGTLKMVIAGDTSGKYAGKVINYIRNSKHADAINVLGRVSNEERLAVMRSSSVILVTSVKEGWGLIVTEANSQGTPAIAYDTDGLRDSVQNGDTGILVPNNDFSAMGTEIVKLLGDKNKYARLRKNAWEWSKEFTFENSYDDFLDASTITSTK